MFVNVGGTIIHSFWYVQQRSYYLELNENRANDKWIWMGRGEYREGGIMFIQIEIKTPYYVH